MTRRCSVCAINYPATPKFKECPVCDEETSLVSNLEPQEDWQERIESGLGAARPALDVKVDDNRLGRFRRAGLGLDRAMEFAGRWEVDLHRFEALRAAGCDVDTAARIVAPL